MFEGILSLLRVDSVFMPIYIYCFLKHLIPLAKNDSPIKTVLFVLVRLVLTAIILPILIAVLSIFAIYAECVRLCAKWIYGDQYYSHLKGADAMYVGDPRIGKGIVNCLYYIAADEPHNYEKAMNHFEITSKQMMRNHPRMECVLTNFMEYFFFIRKPDIGCKMIDYFNEYHSEQEWRNVLHKKMNATFLENNKFLWDISIGKQVVIRNGKNCFPVLIRVHHCVADGISLISLLVTTYVEDGCRHIEMLCEDLQKMMRKPAKKKSEQMDLFKAIMNSCIFLLNKEFYFTTFYFTNPFRSPETNSIHNESAIQTGISSITVSKETDMCEKIKYIKDKLKVSFNDVILGALAASLTEHFLKYDKEIPSSLQTANPFFLKASNFKELVKINKKGETVITLGNHFTVALIDLPIKPNYLKDLKQFVIELNKETERVKYSLDMQFMYWMLNILITITPIPFALGINRFFNPTAIVTNLPNQRLKRVNGNDIVDFEVNTVHSFEIGAAVTMYYYENMFHVATYIDEGYANIEQLNAMGQNVLKTINAIHKDLS